MDVRSVMVALVGVAVAGGSAYGAKQYMQAQAAAPAMTASAATPVMELVNVVVATQDIGYGQAIEPQMLRYQPWPRAALPQGAFTKLEQLLGAADEPARRLKFPLAQGEIVLASKVSGFGEKVTLVQDLGPGSRAMAIKVDAETAVGGFVTPGDMVDVLLTQGRDDELRAMTILQAVRVLGVDQDSNTQNEQPGVARTVTVEVSPEDSQKLALAQKAGTLSLTLRRLDSDVNGPLVYTSLKDLLQEENPVVMPVQKQTVKVRRGTETEVVELSN
jgi:pilus assembly protein CpaB